MPSTTNELLAGRYALLSSLGQGAMGTVWLAEDSLLKRQVAVKQVATPPGLGDAERDALEARLLREARAAARLAHPGIVSVYDVVEHEGQTWIVMEYVDAPTLQERIAQEGPMDPVEAASIGLELLSILAVAHSEGIVHRDVKPGNVMCPPDGHVKLADFGIASVQDDPKITQTGLVLGSPSFMSPEQASTGTSGPEGDLWSLGATLYQAVEGQPPFDKGAAVPTLTAVLSEEPRPMQRAGALAPVIEALLEKASTARPTTAEASAMLEEVIHGGVAPDTRASRASSTIVGDRTVTATAPSKTMRGPLLWGAVAVVAALLIALVVLLGSDTNAPKRGGAAARDERGGAAEDGTSAEGSAQDGTVPEGWTTYTDPSSGYEVSYPAGWEPVVQAENTIDFTDPGSGTYLRVAWTDEPGDDVVERLREIADDFAADHAGYSEVQMSPTTYLGAEAGLWEYTYEEAGAMLHAYNLQFVLDDDYGFALNLQTHEEDWADVQQTWESIKATFRPPS